MVRKKVQVWLPLVFAGIMALGMIIGYQLRGKTTGGDSFLHNINTSPLQEAVSLIKNKYVDNVNMDSLEEPAINGLLDHLDPPPSNDRSRNQTAVVTTSLSERESSRMRVSSAATLFRPCGGGQARWLRR